jgi:hypothetical protein
MRGSPAIVRLQRELNAADERLLVADLGRISAGKI